MHFNEQARTQLPNLCIFSLQTDLPQRLEAREPVEVSYSLSLWSHFKRFGGFVNLFEVVIETLGQG